MAVLVRNKENLIIFIALQNALIGKRSKVQLIDGIRGIGNQLTKEYFVICIDAVNHQIKQLFCFRLKFMGFFCHYKDSFM